MRSLKIQYDGYLPRKNKLHAPWMDRTGKVKMYTTRDAKNAQERLGWTAVHALQEQLGGEKLEGLVHIEFIFRFRNNESDCDGPIAPMIDALKGIAFGDDRMVMGVTAWIDIDEKWKSDSATITIRETGIKGR